MSDSGFQVGTIIGIMIGSLTLVTYPIIWCTKRRKRRKKYYRRIWKKPNKIKQEDLLKKRPYNDYYYSREIDKQIADSLDKKENVLIVGKPLAGKSRTIYEILKLVNNPFSVIIIRIKDINEEDFLIPVHLSRLKRDKLLIIDDLHSFVEKDNFALIVEKFRGKNFTIIAGCRSGFEFNKMKQLFVDKMGSFEGFFSNVFHIDEIDSITAKTIAEKIGLSWEKIKSRFDGTVGSLFMNLDEMWRRFSEGDVVEKVILRELKKINELGMVIEMNVIPIELIRIACTKQDLNLEKYEWEAYFENLQEKEFLKISREDIIIEEVYLEQVVRYVQEYSTLDLFKEMLETFQRIPEALVLLGNRSESLGNITKDTALLKISIQAYKEALKIYTFDNYPIQYAMTMNNLGVAYSGLSDVRDTENNLTRAIQVYEEAMKIRTVDNYPIQYAMNVNNLGVAYSQLSDIRDTENNLTRAIQAFEEALKIYTFDNYPIQYAMNVNNLGGAYRKLSSVRDTENNLTRAIQACEEALKIRTVDKYPLDYARTMYNLGLIFWKLAEECDKKLNCMKADKAFQNVLKIFIAETFPDYNKSINESLKILSEFCQNY